jgi:hypothetical protein
MSVTARVGTAVATGYVLGRFRKLRLAVIAGTALANKQVRDAGLGMIRQGTGQGGSATGSDGMGRQLLDEARSAATAAAATRMNQLSDRLHERTLALGGETPEDEAEQDEVDDEPDDEDEYDDEPEAAEDDEPSQAEHRSPRRRRAAAPVGGR